jgi:hypothetical protein
MAHLSFRPFYHTLPDGDDAPVIDAVIIVAVVSLDLSLELGECAPEATSVNLV